MSNIIFMNELLFNIGKLATPDLNRETSGFDYDIIDIDNKFYLRRLNINRSQNKKPTFNKNCLLELIKTVTYKKTVDWTESTKYIHKEKLIKWCSKYGIPINHGRYLIELIDNHLCVDYSSLSIDLIALRLMFDMWIAMVNQDINSMKVLIKNFANCPYLKEECQIPATGETAIGICVKNFWPIESVDDYIDIANHIGDNFQLAKYFAISISQTIFEKVLSNSCYLCITSPYAENTRIKLSSPFIGNNLNQNLPLLKIDSKTELIDFCYFQLLGIMNTTEGTKHLKECNNPKCKELFWAHHGRVKYCPQCDRRKVWAENNKDKENI